MRRHIPLSRLGYRCPCLLSLLFLDPISCYPADLLSFPCRSTPSIFLCETRWRQAPALFFRTNAPPSLAEYLAFICQCSQARYRYESFLRKSAHRQKQFHWNPRRPTLQLRGLLSCKLLLAWSVLQKSDRRRSDDLIICPSFGQWRR